MLALVAVFGFLPNSIAILNGTLENPDFLIHVHAALMFAWVILFVMQASLIAKKRRSTHIYLGGLGAILALAILLSISYLAITRFPTDSRYPFHTLALFQARRVVLFGAFVAFALWLRNKDSDTHKRLLLLAAMVPLDAAWNRMDFLFDVENQLTRVRAYEFVTFMPLIVYDLYKFGTMHKATLIGGLFFFGTSLLMIVSSGWS